MNHTPKATHKDLFDLLESWERVSQLISDCDFDGTKFRLSETLILYSPIVFARAFCICLHQYTPLLKTIPR